MFFYFASLNQFLAIIGENENLIQNKHYLQTKAYYNKMYIQVKYFFSLFPTNQKMSRYTQCGLSSTHESFQ